MKLSCSKTLSFLLLIFIALPLGSLNNGALASQAVFNELSDEAIEHYKKGRYKNAESKFLEAIEEAGKSTAKDDNLYVGLTNLAGMYKMQSKFALAEPVYKRAMLIQQRDFGPDDLKVAVATDNYCDILMRREKYKDAEEYYRKNLALRQKKLPADDSDIGKNMVNLAEALEEQKSYGEAVALYRKGIPILQEKLGPNDLYVARALNNFGTLYKKQGQMEQAEPLYLRSMAIYEAKSVNQPNIAMVAANLAEVYRKMKKYEDAEGMFKRSILLREKALDPRHISIAYVLEDYSAMLKEMGRVEEATAMDERINNIKLLYDEADAKPVTKDGKLITKDSKK
ncbi:tetratricopeptide repeat protein [bacterium]|nr:tetratricopeptide repeat protein [bacterium]